MSVTLSNGCNENGKEIRTIVVGLYEMVIKDQTTEMAKEWRTLWQNGRQSERSGWIGWFTINQRMVYVYTKLIEGRRSWHVTRDGGNGILDRDDDTNWRCGRCRQNEQSLGEIEAEGYRIDRIYWFTMARYLSLGGVYARRFLTWRLYS